MTASAGPSAPRADAAVRVTFVGHSTVLLELGGVRILTDPFLRRSLGPLERHGPAPDADELGDIDLVLVSHGHPDHFDRRSLDALPGRPTLVVPVGLGPTVRRWLAHRSVLELRPGERVDLEAGRLTLSAVPARHWITPGAPRADPQGYLLDGDLSVWFAGDTGRFEAMRRLSGTVDLALLPVWTWGPHLGPGHLGPRSAADVVADVGARAAIPIHWGTLYPRRLHRLWARPLIEPGDRFAEHVARLSPGSAVRVLRPGGSTKL